MIKWRKNLINIHCKIKFLDKYTIFIKNKKKNLELLIIKVVKIRCLMKID
jgi:hypothetical protein